MHIFRLGNHNKLWEKTGLNNKDTCKSKKGPNKVSGGVLVPCLHATPVANVPGNSVKGQIQQYVQEML